MFGPFSVWSPEFRFPLSGDVQQDIDPILDGSIKGVPMIERRVQQDVASYGMQLGKVLEALQVLADKAGVKLEDIDSLVQGVEVVKVECKNALRDHAEDALRKLKQADPQGFEAVVAGVKP